ncbi:hypothetical protein EDC04DRAFT_2552924, partial [Pisolithus marmoratus]
SAAHSVHTHQQFTQEQQQQQHGMSSGLLPTPPSSPPSFGLHPIENTLSLLESLVAFYHQERMWVYRTRAQLEMDMMQRVEEAAANDAVSATGEAENDSRRSGSGSASPHQNTSQSPPQAQLDSQAPQQPSATSPQGTSPSPPTKWLKRKKAFGLRLEGISTSRGNLNRPRPYPPHPIPLVLGAGGREPCVQILEMFEKMMQARMESCERVTRMVRTATNLGGS